MTRTDPSPPPAAVEALNQNWLVFQRGYAMAILSLLIATWRLWLPTTGFPRVPMSELPRWCAYGDSIAIVAIVTSLGFLMLTQRHQRIAYGVLIVGFLYAFMFNQHRLQPWAYQAVLYGLALATMTPRSVRTWFTAITISIYIYSAFGKLDYQFLHTVGQDFVTMLFGPPAGAGIPISTLRLILAACLPMAELAIGLGLCLQRTRRAAGIAAMAMHTSLIAFLGPWMLDHSLGVLVWNACLLIQAWFLFVSPQPHYCPAQQENPPSRMPLSGLAARIVLIIAMLLPVLERTGYWDHWLSWSLYAPHTSRVEIELHDVSIDELPASVKPFVSEDDDLDHWHRIAIDQWSLELVGAPIYPQARFQLGIAQSIAKTLSSSDGIRVRLKSVADRWNGTRKERWLRGKSEIDKAASEYWLLGEDR